MMIRIKFHENSNSLNLYQLQKAENIITAFNSDISYEDINIIIELFNIKRLFGLKICSQIWDAETTESYSNIVEKFNKPIGVFTSKVNGENIIEFCKQVDLGYKDDFWKLIEYFNIHNSITVQEFNNIIETLPQSLRNIMSCKKIVNTFDSELTQFFINNSKYAELILDDCAITKNTSKRKIHLPKSLKNDEINNILWNYIKSDQANPNYLSLISMLKSCNDEIKASDKIRYAAHKRYNEYWESHHKEGQPRYYTGVEVSFYDDSKVKQKEFEYDEKIMKFFYGTTWFKENMDYPTLLNNFIHIFNFVDRQGRCTFLSNPSRLSVFESIFGVDGEKIYKTGIDYGLKSGLSSVQLYGYSNYLKANEINIENIFKWFFETYLVDEFSAKGFSYIEPSNNATALEKILVLIPQIDGIIKQFTFFLEDEFVDREYFEYSSDRILVTSASSMIKNKYIYPNGQSINTAMHLMFSDQSMLFYSDGNGKEYNDFVEFIENNHMRVEDFEEHNRADVELLIKEKYINIDGNGYINIDVNKAVILKDLFFNEVISYKFYEWKYPTIATILDEWINDGKVIIENTLFTRQEQKYIDYMLNAQRYINGPELRNKYAHGIFSLDEKKHQQDYIELLKIMIVIILKINEEFCSK